LGGAVPFIDEPFQEPDYRPVTLAAISPARVVKITGVTVAFAQANQWDEPDDETSALTEEDLKTFMR
jgi:hypothetical protein